VVKLQLHSTSDASSRHPNAAAALGVPALAALLLAQILPADAQLRSAVRLLHRRTPIDLRLSKIFPLGARMRLRANLDVYNVLNDGSVVNTNNNYGASWLQPIGGAFTAGLVDGRLIQFGGQLTF
jgi:hypothetical protein